MKIDLIFRAFLIALLGFPHSNDPTYLVWIKGVACVVWLIIGVWEIILYRGTVAPKRRYKIALSDTGYYNVFYSFRWFPFWIKSNSWISSFTSIEKAKEYISKLENPVYL